MIIPVFFIGLLACLVSGETVWERNLVLDEDLGVKAWWNVSKGDVTSKNRGWLDMEIFAPTQGYVGVGFSSLGGMRGADIVVGWVDDEGKSYIRDFHGVGNTIPSLDKVQNYELIGATQTEEGTKIRFRRELNTCDEHDFEITDNTVRLMWSYGEKDPVISDDEESGESVGYSYHANRGVRSVYMLDKPLLHPFPDQVENPDPSIQHWDYKVNVTTDEEYLYFCKIAKFPKAPVKHHMIGFRPLIPPESKKFVHHVCMYECRVPEELGGTADMFEKYLDHEGGKCYTNNIPADWSTYCVAFFTCWVSGSEGEMFPEHVGSPAGEPDGAGTYFMFEVHYDNPQRELVKDTTALRVYYTDKLRENDGNILLVSYRITPFMLIPPKQTKFTTVGICSAECTQATFPKEGIKIISVLLHGHLAARSLRLRHFRNGTELPALRDDKTYDFNYQQALFLKEEVTVLPGDELVTECDYSTSDRRRSVLGGFTTQEEMCQAFVMYYPRVGVGLCSSQYEFHNFFDSLGIQNVSSKLFPAMNMPYDPTTWPKEKQKYDPVDNAKELLNANDDSVDVYDKMFIQAPEKFKDKSVGEYLQFLTWKNRRFSKNVEKKWTEGKHYAYCTAHDRKRFPLKDFIIDYPKHTVKPRANNICLAKQSS